MDSQTPAMFSPRAKLFATLGLRVLTSISLLISLIILVSTVVTVKYNNHDHQTLHFYEYAGYWYMFVTIALGIAYSVLQALSAVVRIRKQQKENLLLDFFGDKVLSIALASGAVAGFVLTTEIKKHNFGEVAGYAPYHKYLQRSYAADGFVFLAFIFAFILSILSSYALPKRV